jgi:hypothetical protein
MEPASDMAFSLISRIVVLAGWISGLGVICGTVGWE